MKSVLQTWHQLAGILAGWSNRELQQIIDYLRAENVVLWEKLGRDNHLLKHLLAMVANRLAGTRLVMALVPIQA